MEINEEKLREILKGQQQEYQRHLGILTESFESQVKIVAESVSGIQQQLIAIREMVAMNTKNIEVIREMVAMNSKDIEIIKADIQFIKQSFKHKIDLEEFENLEKRVLFLEKKVGQV